MVADLALEGSADRLVGEAGDIDILVANAGLPATGKIDDFSEQEIARALRVNLEAPMRMARLLVPAMAERGDGHLLFIASLAGKAPSPRSSVYNATKFGLRGFALGLRCDLGGSGVGVSIVSPGFVGGRGCSPTPAPRGGPASAPTRPSRSVWRCWKEKRATLPTSPSAAPPPPPPPFRTGGRASPGRALGARGPGPGPPMGSRRGRGQMGDPNIIC